MRSAAGYEKCYFCRKRVYFLLQVCYNGVWSSLSSEKNCSIFPMYTVSVQCKKFAEVLESMGFN